MVEKVNDNVIESPSSKRQLREIADNVAQTKGFKDVKDMSSQMKDKVLSKNDVISRDAKAAVSSYLGEMALASLKQIIETSPSNDYISFFANVFDDGYLTEGNSRQYIIDLATGNGKYADVEDEFVPTEQTNPLSEWKSIVMFVADNTLAPDAFQYYKDLTLSEKDWLPYFTSEALSRFIASIQSKILKSWRYFKFDKNVNYIMKTAETFNKQIQGEGKDTYECFKEFLRHIANMEFTNSEYNIGGGVGPDLKKETQSIGETSVDNLIVIMSARNKGELAWGIKSQLFNAQLLNFKGILDDSKIKTLGNKLIIGDMKTPIQVDKDTPYIDDNTIIVFDKRAFRFIYQINEQGTQYFPRNLKLQLCFHLWATMGYLPWYQGFVYKNPNLTVAPSSNMHALGVDTPTSTFSVDEISEE